MAKDTAKKAAPVDHVEEPDNNPDGFDNAPDGRTAAQMSPAEIERVNASRATA